MMMSVGRKIMGLALVGTGFPRVDAVILCIIQYDDWNITATQGETYLYQLRATLNLDIFEPFTPEQKSLCDYLSARKASKKLCDYAWRSYAQSVT